MTTNLIKSAYMLAANAYFIAQLFKLVKPVKLELFLFFILTVGLFLNEVLIN